MDWCISLLFIPILFANSWYNMTNLPTFIPPAVENAVPPTIIRIIMNALAAAGIDCMLIYWNPVLVEALTVWNAAAPMSSPVVPAASR